MIGYRLTECQGAFWRDNQGGLLALSPPFLLGSLDPSKARHILRHTGALFIRWESDFDGSFKGAWWHVIKDDASDLAELSGNTRSKVRRGLKAYNCASLTRKEVVTEGYDVYLSAFSRYKTHERRFSHGEFQDAIKSLPEQVEFWGVREKGTSRLVAFSENYVEEKTCFYNTIWFDVASLKKYSSYVLFYEMNSHYLNERLFRYVSDGARNISHGTEIHDFLISKFGFRRAYSRLHIIYTPWLGVLVKMAYPCRYFLSRVPLPILKKAVVLLNQERCRRMS